MNRQYRGIIKNQFISDLSYREHYITFVVVNVVFYFVLFFLWKAIYAGNADTINGLTFEAAFISLALTGSLTRTLSGGMEWDMCFDMMNGNIIIKMVKPTRYVYYVLAEKIGGAITHGLIMCVPLFIILYFVFPGMLHYGIRLIPFIISMIISFFIMFTLEFATGVLTFYTQSVWGLSTIKDLIIGFFAGAEVPLAFFPPVLSRIADVLPFKSMYYGPVQLLMSETVNWADCGMLILRQLCWAGALFLMVQLLYRVMIKKIVVNGG